MKIMDWVKIKIGLYTGMTAQVVDILPDPVGVLVRFGTGFQMRFCSDEVEVIEQ